MLAAANRTIAATATGYSAPLLSNVSLTPAELDRRVSVVDAGNGVLEGQIVMDVLEGSTNAIQGLHGGAVSALSDILSSWHLWGSTEEGIDHVSVSLEVQYYAAARLGAQVLCVTRAPRIGGRISYLDFEWYALPPPFAAEAAKTGTQPLLHPSMAARGDMLYKGSHVKAMIHKKKK
jgi:acyl-coenzyme A thioesterase PaaI-like protein